MKKQKMLDKVLELVKSNQLSAEQGMEMIKTLRKQKQGDAIERTPDTELLFFDDEWVASDLPNTTATNNTVLLFDNNQDLSTVLKEYWKQQEIEIVRVVRGMKAERRGDGHYAMNPENDGDYEWLLNDLYQCGRHPDIIIHAWSDSLFQLNIHNLSEQLASSFYSLFTLCKSMMVRKLTHPVKLLYVFESNGSIQPQYAAMSGFLKSVRQENPVLDVCCLELCDASMNESAQIIAKEALNQDGEADVQILRGERRVKRQIVCSLETDSVPSVPLRQRGVYIITGGLGGVGYLFARYLAATVQARLVLCGRSALTSVLENKITELESLGAEVLYIQGDVSVPDDTERTITEAKRRFSCINGVIHSAGAIFDSFLINKEREHMEAVVKPKLFGTLLMDEATRNEKLDWFVVFSSLSSVWGNPGQCDYAFANLFLSHFCSARGKLREEGSREGLSLAINWPFWKEGGMKFAEALQSEDIPLLSLPTDEGIKSWELALASGKHQISVLYGKKGRLAEWLQRMEERSRRIGYRSPTSSQKSEVPIQALYQYIKTSMGSVLKLSPDRIDNSTPFQEYGLDSIAIKLFNSKMESDFGEMSKTLLYEYQTVDELVDFFAVHYADRLGNVLGLEKVSTTVHRSESIQESKRSVHETSCPQAAVPERGAVAIVGIGGQYPGARTIEDFWDVLKSGTSCFTEIPQTRWKHGDYGNDISLPLAEGDIYCKYGAFLDGVDEFDPMLFKMNPLEAKMINPEERKFLETVWSALEDAGYAKEAWSGKKVGVFVGVTSMTYPLLGANQWNSSDRTPIHSTYFSLPNRISYFFNFTGPSLALDTACSSSLAAIHLACRSILNGESEAAIAGGVNLYLHPSRYLGMCQSKMLSTKEQTSMFDADGNGFIPGEGVGAVLMKSLERAIEDGDYVYGIIRGSGISHKGYSSGFFLPDPQSQTGLIEEVMNSSGVHPETIGYVELQALGSDTTDTIEWTGIRRAYEARTSVRQYCAVGSVKPIIGHLEAAAGISQLTKVLLQMKYKAFVPNKVADSINPSIRLEASPFYIPTELTHWPAMTIHDGDSYKELPRRSAISSFGAGGLEAHLIVEEYKSIELPPSAETLIPGECIVPLSARSSAQLRRYAERLLQHLERHDYPTAKMPDIAYTLQFGREAFAERTAFVCRTPEELKEQIGRYLAVSAMGDRADWKIEYSSLLASQIENEQIVKLLERWMAGEQMDWPLVNDIQRRRVPLPTYPFEQRKCWLYSANDESIPNYDGRSKPALNDQDAVVADYYDASVRLYEESTEQEGYLTFAPFSEKITGFSWLNVFSEPQQYSAMAQFALAKQKEMRDMLYRHVDFSKVNHLLDIGCGFSTDLLHLARAHEHIHCDGYTISANQAEFGQRRVGREGLEDRITIHCKDSAKEDFPGMYDLIIGLEVTVHIADKHGVFGNIARHLKRKGTVVLADCLANTVNEVHLPHVGQYTNTQGQYSRILAENRLRVIDCIDCSQEISNFLHDPEFEQNLSILKEKYPHLADMETEHRAWNNFGKALSLNLFRYVLLTLEKADDLLTQEQLLMMNESAFKHAASYTDAVGKWLGNSLHYKEDVVYKRAEEAALPHHVGGINGDTIRKMEDKLAQWFADTLEMKPTEIDRRASFSDYGIDSLIGLKILDDLNRKLELNLQVQTMFDHSNLRDLTQYLAQTHPEVIERIIGVQKPMDCSLKRDDQKPPVLERFAKRGQENKNECPTPTETAIKKERTGLSGASSDVAVIGISGRFPGAENVRELWENLRQGVDSVHEVQADRWNPNMFYDPDPLAPNKTYGKWGGFVADMDKFDPAFFQISPAEVEMMDPQQRLFLQESYRALEDAGYAPEKLNRVKCGVIAGVFGNEYSAIAEGTAAGYNAQLMLGNTNSILASRISYFLNLKGPAISVDTACSSSLVAVHLACKSLLNGETDMMLAGGVTLYLTEKPFISMSKAGMLSKDGKCKTFADDADGIVPAEAAAAVVLKRLDRAVADGDYIYGVIKGSEINQDGRTNGITAPSAKSQTEIELEVYRKYGIHPETITYLEAHGTGTKLGDPIEIAALTQAFATYTDRKQFCAIGSAKSNLGHTSAASGVVGLIKILLSMKYKLLPPTLHAAKENEHIDFKATPFFVNRELQEWASDGAPRRAAINSFGFSGTNCHMIVEEAPQSLDVEPLHAVESNAADLYIFPLSAKNKERLQDYALQIVRFISGNDGREQPNIANLCYTFQIGRRMLEERVGFVIGSISELQEKLLAYGKGERNIEGMFTGTSKQTDEKYGLLLEGEEGRQFVEAIIRNRKLHKLAQIWVSGVDLNWEFLYGCQAPHRIPAPTYPFAKERYWPEDRAKICAALPQRMKSLFQTGSKEVADGEEDSRGTDYTYVPRWKQAPTPSAEGQKSQIGSKQVLIMTSDSSDPLVAAIRSLHSADEVSVTVLGRDAAEIYPSQTIIDASNPLAIHQHISQYSRLNTVYFLANFRCSAGEQISMLEDSQEQGTLSLFRLVKALMAAQLDLGLELRIVTYNHYNVLPDDIVTPFGAGVHGLARTLAKELPQLRLTQLDLSWSDVVQNSNRNAIMSLAKAIAYEPAQARGETIAIRGFQKFKRILVPEKITVSTTPTRFRHQGAYVIVGGLGTVGYIFAEYMAKTSNASLALIGRSEMNTDMQKKIEHLESLGGKVIYLQANVADYDAMRIAIERTKSQFGTIHGIIHSALDVQPQAVQDMSETDLRTALESKAKGSVVLYTLVQHEPLDFFLFFSSAQSFIGTAGWAHYAASCEFKDAYVSYLQTESHFPVYMVNWGYWAKRRGESNEELTRYIERQGAYPLSETEGLQLIESLLGTNIRQVAAIKAQPYVLELMNVDHSHSVTFEFEKDNMSPGHDVSMKIAGKGAGIEEVMELITRSVAEVLHMDSASINFELSFMELGVDSILALSIVKIVNDALQTDLTPKDIFDHATIGRLADYIVGVDSEEDEDERLFQLFKSLERKELDVDAAGHLLRGASS